MNKVPSECKSEGRMAFNEIPVLDLSEARNVDTKPGFLTKLRDALLNVGFLYIKNVGIDQETFDRVCEAGIKFFDLPEEEKLAIEMKNKPSFLGYSRVGHGYIELARVYTMVAKIQYSLGMKSQHTRQIGESSMI